MKRQQTGSVGIEIVGTRLRIRLPRQVTTNRYISTGLENTPGNYRSAQMLAWDIAEDIAANRLQPYQNYLDRISPKPAKPLTPKPEPPTLSALWAKYCDYKQPQLAATTYRSDYCKKWASHITKLPQSLDKAVDLRDTLVTQTSIDTAKRLLTMLSACCSWAVKSGLIAANPFVGLASDLKRPKATRSIDPFSTAERDSILEAFKTERPHYYPFVQFLFLTGCRTGEAVALQWKHIAHDLSGINFCESYSSKLKIRKSTKTGASRKFPCNSDMRGLLASIRPANPQPTDLVFSSTTGTPIDNSRFTSRIWKGGTYGGNCYKGIIPSLVASGSVASYRCPYTTRHTFITMMLQAGLTIPQVAKLVGNSPEILLKHYAGNSVDRVPRI